MQQSRGFTIIEMLVSMALFTSIMTISVASLLVVIDANGKAQSQQVVANNVAFAIDLMSRELRMGERYHCSSFSSITTGPAPGSLQDDPQNCTNGNTAIAFTDVRTGERKAFSINNNVIMQKVGDTGEWQPLTGSEMTVTDLAFTVTGASASDNVQPSVTIFIAADSMTGAGNLDTDLQTTMQLQTTVVQRKLDV